jgi:hypothetical protein
LKIKIKKLLPLQYLDLKAQANQLSSILCLGVISQQAKADAQEECMGLTLNLLKIRGTLGI